MGANLHAGCSRTSLSHVPVLSTALDEAAVTDESVSGSGLKPDSQVFAPFLCGMFAFIDLYCTQPLLPLLSGVFHASEAKVSLTITLRPRESLCRQHCWRCLPNESTGKR